MEPRENRFPSNSYSSRGAAKKEIKSVVKGSTKAKEKSLGEKIVDTFVKTDVKSAGSYIFTDILVPAFIDMVVDGIEGFVQTVAYGDRRRGSTRASRTSSGSAYVPYSSVSRNSEKGAREPQNERLRSRNIVEDLTFEYKEDLLNVLDNISELIQEFDSASIMDLYSYANYKVDDWQNKNVLNSYGWTDISKAEIYNERGGGFTLRMPKPERLKN